MRPHPWKPSSDTTSSMKPFLMPHPFYSSSGLTWGPQDGDHLIITSAACELCEGLGPMQKGAQKNAMRIKHQIDLRTKHRPHVHQVPLLHPSRTRAPPSIGSKGTHSHLMLIQTTNSLVFFCFFFFLTWEPCHDGAPK